jgi:hypothetical protein
MAVFAPGGERGKKEKQECAKKGQGAGDCRLEAKVRRASQACGSAMESPLAGAAIPSGIGPGKGYWPKGADAGIKEPGARMQFGEIKKTTAVR